MTTPPETALTCPRCDQAMDLRDVGRVAVHACPAGHGIFLDRVELTELAQAEAEWHRSDAFQTQPLPRITPGMTVPPPLASRANAYVETLFG